MYDHYIAVDWAQSNMAISRMTGKSKDIKTMDTISDLGNLRAYLKTLKGKKILTI